MAAQRRRDRWTAAAAAAARARLNAAPLTADYLALVDPRTFAPAGPDFTGTALLLVAARVGSTRLIDNVIVGFGPYRPGESVRAGE